MKTTLLGSTGMRVSRLCLGTMTFGREADEATAALLYRRSREAGINIFDCADVYAGGASERILGALAAGERDHVVLTSKVGMRAGLRAEEVDQGIEGSLRRLGTDRVEVYFCHRFDPDTPVEETLRAMDRLVRAGKVRALGVSNWAAWQVARALGWAALWQIAPVQVLQPMYNLAKRTAEIEILPLAAAERLGVLTYSPLGGGLLTGKYADPDAGADGRLRAHDLYARRYAAEDNYLLAQRFTALAAESGVHPVTLAVAWVAAHPAVTAPIIGARSLGQLEPALAAADHTLDDAARARISALTPPVPPATDRSEEAGVPARAG